jgi:hypothetical protein
MTSDERNFIIELEALSRKYKLQIAGCGCCGSPRVEKIAEVDLEPEAGYVLVNHLEWASSDHVYWDCEDSMYKNIVIGKEKG